MRVKFRSAFYDTKTDKFDFLQYWGIDYPEKGIDTWRGANNSCYIKTDDIFIGLKDKNGKEIYEGDILRKDGVKMPYIVKYAEIFYSGFVAEKIDKSFCLNIFPYRGEFEIIGNIHENPELLKQKR